MSIVKKSKAINKTSAHYKRVLISMLGKVNGQSKPSVEGGARGKPWLGPGVSIQLMKADDATARRSPCLPLILT